MRPGQIDQNSNNRLYTNFDRRGLTYNLSKTAQCCHANSFEFMAVISRKAANSEPGDMCHFLPSRYFLRYEIYPLETRRIL